MIDLPQAYSAKRSPRLRLRETIPALLRSPSGHKGQGELQTISMTGGLLGLAAPLSRGAQVKLMFVTRAGAIQGSAEMLRPVAWNMQPFRFLSLDENSTRRLRATIEPKASEPEADAWIGKYRAAMENGNRPRKRILGTIFAALMVAAASVCVAVYLHVIPLR
jgi:hypothetical protein